MKVTVFINGKKDTAFEYATAKNEDETIIGDYSGTMNREQADGIVWDMIGCQSYIQDGETWEGDKYLIIIDATTEEMRENWEEWHVEPIEKDPEPDRTDEIIIEDLETCIFIEEDEEECKKNDWFYYIVDETALDYLVVRESKIDLFLRHRHTHNEYLYSEWIAKSQLKKIEI